MGEVVQLLDEFHITVALVIRAGFQGVVDFFQPFFDRLDLGERAFDLPHQGMAVFEIYILAQNTHADIAVVGQRAFIRPQVARQHFEQSGFAGPVLAGQTYPVALVYAKTDPGEQRGT